MYTLDEWIRTSNIRADMDSDFKYLSSVSNKFGIPNIIVLKNFIQKKIRVSACTKKNIFLRDMYVCQYCEKKLGQGKCTIDHVIAASKGGELSWYNAVTCCRDCNNTKGHKTLEECGYKLIKKPKPLRWDREFFNSYIRRYPNKNWERFLGVRNEEI